MVNRQELLSDLKRVLRQLEADLRQRCDELPEVDAALRGEYDAAKEAQRTAESFEEWRTPYITQAAAAWVLGCVFARFLEDNQLVDPPRISGPGERLRRARDEYEIYFHKHPSHTAREYLLDVFDRLGELPGGRDIFGKHNPVHEQRGWLSGDAARSLLEFFQRIEPATGDLVHDFTDGDWDTRFLGDLYQDLSEDARKKYALLQTPEFVEEFILDRTLDPAIEEFGLRPPSPASERGAGGEGGSESENYFRMIDPACGSGHFLLGSYHRLFHRWSRKEPGTNPRVLAQRALDSVHGVDVNPYAVAIARFRLLLAALRGCRITRLADAPAFRINIACGDSLLHGTSNDQLVLGFDPLAHAYQSEDLADLRRILKPGSYHAVVANPPYITPKDRALNQAYRMRYSACHRQYSLSVPFMQRLFGLAVSPPLPPGEGRGEGAGFVGQITSNSFMKREFGKKIIQDFLPRIDLTHVIDTSGAYVPGHGTPTAILFGRNRKPVANTIRTVMGIRGEPSTPDDPSRGCVWSAILQQTDQPGSQSEFISVCDSPRETFCHHPWSLGGGGAAELKDAIDQAGAVLLGDEIADVGRTTHTGNDEVFYLPNSTARTRAMLDATVPLVTGDSVRDYRIETDVLTVFPYDRVTAEPVARLPLSLQQHLWCHRTSLSLRRDFGQTILERGYRWFDHSMFFPARYRGGLSIPFAFVATHNHFVLDRGAKVFNRHAPAIRLNSDHGDEPYLALCGTLNSALACFWIKQVCHNKGSTVDQHGARQTTVPFEDFWEHDAVKLKRFPLPEQRPLKTAQEIDQLATRLALASPKALLRAANAAEALEEHRSQWERIQHAMIARQEELDWEIYRLYGLVEGTLTYPHSLPEVRLGQRAFEIVMARKMAAGELETTWFVRHGSTPITEVPPHWPEDYRKVVQRRIEVIETNRNIALIEQPEYKRRWNAEPWDQQLERAVKSWLLDRLESYFDFDGRMNDDGKPTAKIDNSLISTARLADLAARDADFMRVGELHRGRPDFDVARLVAELVEDESVPLLPVLRYKPAAMEKRRAWEQTWELQREEDKVLGSSFLVLGSSQPTANSQEPRTKNKEPIPVPPEYKGTDFQKTTYWRLRGKLDVPKERWVSFPHCEGEDRSLVVAWAGYDHLQLAQAVGTYYAEIKERGGTRDPRLVPLLACILELVPWLKQWHNDLDPTYNLRMGDYYAGFVDGEAKELEMTVQQIRDWEPPRRTGRRRRK